MRRLRLALRHRRRNARLAQPLHLGPAGASTSPNGSGRVPAEAGPGPGVAPGGGTLEPAVLMGGPHRCRRGSRAPASSGMTCGSAGTTARRGAPGAGGSPGDVAGPGVLPGGDKGAVHVRARRTELPVSPQGVPASDFFSDVWRSADGVRWREMTAGGDPAMRWTGRARLSAAVFGDYIYVMGGSKNDDQAIGGPGGPPRIYFNDVWRSRDGQAWEEVTPNAAWTPRAGAVVVAKDNHLYLLGGEDGFFCDPTRPIVARPTTTTCGAHATARPGNSSPPQRDDDRARPGHDAA